MKKTVLLVLALYLISIAPELAFAGAWTLPENNIRLEWLTKALWAKEDFGNNDKRERKSGDARSWGWSMIPKVEFGVTDWFTIFGSLEYKESKYKEYARNPAWGPYSVKNHAITNVDVGGKVRLLKDPVVLSLQMKGIIYTGYADGDPNGVQEQPGLSDRDDALEFRVLAGKVFDDMMIPFYLGAESGYRFRNRDVANDIPLFTEFGFWPLNWLLIKTEIDCYFSHAETGEIDKEYAIWRIGPVFQLLDIYRTLTGGDMSDSPSKSSVTQSDKSLNLEVQYGNTIWGKDTSKDQELVVKLSTQF